MNPVLLAILVGWCIIGMAVMAVMVHKGMRIDFMIIIGVIFWPIAIVGWMGQRRGYVRKKGSLKVTKRAK